MHARHDRDSPDPDREPGNTHEPEGLLGKEAETEKRDEDRNRGLRDRCDARVDVRLSPGDEAHRERGVDESENEAGEPGRAQLRERAPGARGCCQVAEEQETRDEEPDVRHRGRRKVLDPDLDEEVRRAPDRREQEEERPVALQPPEAIPRSRG